MRRLHSAWAPAAPPVCGEGPALRTEVSDARVTMIWGRGPPPFSVGGELAETARRRRPAGAVAPPLAARLHLVPGMRTLTLLAALVLALPALATPSSVIWVNSLDAQAFGTVHLGVDNYVAARKGASPLSADMGLTFGVSPSEKLKLELGADFWANAASPLWLNGKLATPEGEMLPAIALGIYGAGIDKASGYHVSYLIGGKTFGKIGRFTLGGYYGLGDPALFGGSAITQRGGLIAAYERTLTEISEDLWFGADVQTGKHAFGAVSAGFAYKLGPATSILVGYNRMFDSKNLPSTIYVALDADLTLFAAKPAATPEAAAGGDAAATEKGNTAAAE